MGASAGTSAGARPHEDLTPVRSWTHEQLSAVIDTLRRKSCVYRVTKEEFARYFGGRHREVLSLFGNLDTDADGFVDVFEILTVIVLWSGTSWEEKHRVLFSLFDLMGKGYLKIDEFLLLGTVLTQTLAKFFQNDAACFTQAELLKLMSTALPHSETKLTFDLYRAWYPKCAPLEELRAFIEETTTKPQEEVDSGLRQKINDVEAHSKKLFDRIERLQDRLPDFTDACVEFVTSYGRKKRWEFLMQNVRQLILKLQNTSEHMHTSFVDLEASLADDESSGGMAMVIDPSKRFKQEQAIINLDQIRQESLNDYWASLDVVQRLIELTEPAEKAALGFSVDSSAQLGVINEDENDEVVDPSPPRVIEQRALMKRIVAEMQNDMKPEGCFHREKPEKAAFKDQIESLRQRMGGGEAAGEPAGMLGAPAAEPGGARPRGMVGVPSEQPTMVAIADFDPPASHSAQMVKLAVGDRVQVLGQDGRGWWFGRTSDGKEGWFPPSYVQLPPES